MDCNERIPVKGKIKKANKSYDNGYYDNGYNGFISDDVESVLRSYGVPVLV